MLFAYFNFFLLQTAVSGPFTMDYTSREMLHIHGLSVFVLLL